MLFEDLCDLKLTNEETGYLFHKGTRDNSNIKVYKDINSGIIYIKDFYIGDEEYIQGKYRGELSNFQIMDSERSSDCYRRTNAFEDLYLNRDILDFGCGHGDFLLKVKKSVKSCVGIELQKNLRDFITSQGIDCYEDISSFKEESFDTIFLFHVFEHLHEPRKFLKQIYRYLKKNGTIVIEVPNANDFLISKINQADFIKFTLWSQHLILHTKKSLETFLIDANLNLKIIKGVQRYNLSNHINWIKKGTPEGNNSEFSIIDNKKLNNEYEKSLSNINSTDTLIAIATK